MIILRSSEEVKSWTKNVKQNNKSLGFVPTMGALHSGHISLVESSKIENDFTVVSIFVNPTQFNNSTDLLKYPRTEQADAELLESAGVDVLFLPSVDQMYPQETTSKFYEFGGLENQMEGKFRPGHFNGVATIVEKFFEIVEPDRAYFGEKDFQQLRIIQELVFQKQIPTQIVPIPILRESDGLAMSSRNMRLTPEMRLEAPKIYQILLQAKEYIKNHNISETKEFVENEFSKTQLDLEYFEIAEEKSLESVEEKKLETKLRGFLAAFAGDIRLIDNIPFN